MCYPFFYAPTMTSPVETFKTSHFPPALSMASRAVLVKAWAWTVIPLPVNASLPTTILCTSYLDLVTALASSRELTAPPPKKGRNEEFWTERNEIEAVTRWVYYMFVFAVSSRLDRMRKKETRKRRLSDFFANPFFIPLAPYTYNCRYFQKQHHWVDPTW